MDKQPEAQKWRVIRFIGGSYRIPLPPGPQPGPTKAQRELEREQHERGDATVARLHLVGAFRVGMIVMCLALVVIVIIAVLALTHH